MQSESTKENYSLPKPEALCTENMIQLGEQLPRDTKTWDEAHNACLSTTSVFVLGLTSVALW